MVRAINLGIVADEFFDPQIGRMGGFGWAARQVVRFFNLRPSLGVKVVLLAASLKGRLGQTQIRVHATPFIFHFRGPNYRRLIREQKLDLVLTIDYRPQYRNVLMVLAGRPVIVWVRDPRPLEVTSVQATLRMPYGDPARPQGIKRVDCTSLATLLDSPAQPSRRFLLATPAPSLIHSIAGAFGVSDIECMFLPNIVDIPSHDIKKHDRPRAIYLGRLDPIKRPWLFVELARLFPTVEFLMLGQSHFRGPGSWLPRRLPQNVKLLGHVDGTQKRELLSSGWVLVNTSIHEALATSFLEALACETPLLSCTNQEDIVSRFGIFIGTHNGDGMASLPYFAAGLERLIEDVGLRNHLGKAGREWVLRTHNEINFLEQFKKLCAAAGLSHLASNGLANPAQSIGTAR
jgi:glycosyltransferase involved in cell wall biosynthesis